LECLLSYDAFIPQEIIVRNRLFISRSDQSDRPIFQAF
jgi:hypothetical protein